MPSWELFEAQPQAYRDQVLPPEVTARVAIEAGVPLGWSRYVGTHGDVRRDRESLWRVGPVQNRVRKIRLHRRERDGAGAEITRQITKDN